MTREEVRTILAVLRSGEHDAADPLFAEALQHAASDPELARWFAEEQEFDQAFAAKLQETPIPPDLRARVLAAATRRSENQWVWIGRAILAAAAIVLLALLLNPVRQPGHILDQFRGEMISFVKLTPPLEVETADLDRIQDFLRRTQAPTPAEATIPPGLKALAPAGCRVLSFRGHKVTLICFKREDGRVAHLFVVERAALPRLPGPSEAIVAAEEGEWITAAWQEGDKAYVVAAQGERTLIRRFLTRS